LGRKKICIVANNPWYIYNFRFNLVNSLKDEGFQVVIVAPEDDKYTDLLKKDFEVYNIYMNAKGINPIADLKTIFEFYKIYKKLSPDVVLNFTIKPNIYSSFITRILKIDTISNITGLGTVFIKKSFITSIVKVLYKISLRNNSKIFFQNNDDRELFILNESVVEKNTGLLPGSGVDLSKFIPKEKIENHNNFIFLFIGRIIKDKGVIELIKAIQILKVKNLNFEVHILGSINTINNTAISKEELDSWIDDDLIKYLGVSDNVEEIIQSSDCVVLPSYREGTPRVLLEACAMKVPIITTNTVGCKDVVIDSINGYLCKVKNSKDLANKMEKMINLSKEERIAMGKAGREKMIREFDEKIVINKYIQEIKLLLNK